MKGGGVGGISETTCPTEVVRLSKFAEFYKENSWNIVKTVWRNNKFLLDFCYSWT